ncbi:hypothetical protein [Spongiactinospora sp. TRM90649]|uniref:hypothetical protein n=1 Tax=Spongiactinospora sp. TRM90649 TaxID=3031114 RepID=UPI0023F9494B|nr:hypothetical protein [Spongiactinospora sp. TRM90649]MDF5751422.1 hypothetical protein [Spongiactinospora sp. TRM90649]
MNRIQRDLALSAVSLLSAGALAASPAHAAASPDSTYCPTPSKAEFRKAKYNEPEHPPRGAAAVKGLRVGHIPKGFFQGHVTAAKHDGMTEYGYRWTDGRDDVDREHRSLWVRVACWPGANKPTRLKNVPFEIGRFQSDAKTRRIGGRRVLTQRADGALGHGRYVGWVERKGIVITVLVSDPVVPRLGEIVRGIRLANR